jgi:hypothetical protein
MSVMDDLTAFLAARYDEAETIAQKLLRTAQDVGLELKEPRLLGKHIPGWGYWPDVEAMCTGRLADVALKRAILADAARVFGATNDLGAFKLAERTIRQLGTEFSDHTDYRQEWAP